METDFRFEVLFRMSDGRYLYVEADLPTGWMYTLYDAAGTAITGGNVDGSYQAAYGVALEALRQMGTALRIDLPHERIIAHIFGSFKPRKPA